MDINTSPELFRNIKRVPDPSSKEYQAFFDNEKLKIQNGVTINGVHFGGWLYWHINHWRINIDMEPDSVTGIMPPRKTLRPYLRDNEWIIDKYLTEAERIHWGLEIIGSRQFAKSEIGASYLARKAIAYENSQNVVAGLSTDDLTTLTSKCDLGLTSLHPYFRPVRILDQWTSHVVFGYKDKQGTRYKYSEILIRNLVAGKKTESLAGPTTSSLIIDEIGKDEFLEALVASIPSLETPYGWRCSPLLTGTSGSFDKSADLQKFHSKLKTYKFLSVEMKDEHGKIVHFIPGFQASRAKRKKIRLSTYLGIKRGESHELDITAIHIVPDVKVEADRIRAEIEDFKKAGEYTNAKKIQMYYPLTEDDLFLNADLENPFLDIRDICKAQLKYLEGLESDEMWGWMSRGIDGKPEFNITTTAVPIQTWPTDEKEDKNAPIVIYSKPLPGQEFGILHVSGADPYNQDESYYSPSLGSLYIFRRNYDLINGIFQQRIVAVYSARPQDIGHWQEQVRLLLEWYGATCLPENEEASFIRYFDTKNLGHYIEDGMDLAREINPKTEIKRKKGLGATTPNIRYGNGMLKTYCAEDIVVGQDAFGESIIKPGVVRIPDKVLLKEIIGYDPKDDIKKNVDRIVAFRHALILADVKDKFYPISRLKAQPDPNAKKKKVVHSPFATKALSAFGRFKKTPFNLK